MNAVDVLLAAKDKVMDGWCRGHRAEDASGEYRGLDGDSLKFLDGWDPRAAAWCLLGAIEGAQGFYYGEMGRFAFKFTTSRGYGGPTSFNDATGRTKEQVIAMLDEMIMYAKDHPDLVVR